MSEDIEWVCFPYYNTRIMKGWLIWEEREADPAKIGLLAEAERAGEPLPASAFPPVMYPDTSYTHRKIKKIPYANVASLGIVLNAECAEIFRQHDLGNGNLYPVQIFEFDRKTPIEGEYFSLHIGNQKDVCLFDRSPGLRERAPGTDLWRKIGEAEDYGVTVSPAALEGPDIWVQPRLLDNFFISDRLAKALQKQKMFSRFRMRKVRVA